MGIAFGLAVSLPVAYVVVANIMHGTEKVKEALVAFVIAACETGWSIVMIDSIF